MANAKRYEELSQDTLQQMYINDNMSAYEIAAAIGCSVSAVHAAARHYGLRKRTSGAVKQQAAKTAQVPESLMRELYVDKGMTLEEVHEELHSRNLTDKEHDNPNSPFRFLDAKPSSEILQDLYDECHNVNELADKIGVCHKTALNWLREYGIPLVQQKRITKSQLEAAIAKNDSLSAVAKELGHSEDLIIQYAQNYGYNVFARKA